MPPLGQTFLGAGNPAILDRFALRQMMSLALEFLLWARPYLAVGCPLDAKVVAAGHLVSHFNVVHIAALQELFHCRLVAALVDINLGDELLPLCVPGQHRCMAEQVAWVACILLVSFAILSMNENWTGERYLFDA